MCDLSDANPSRYSSAEMTLNRLHRSSGRTVPHCDWIGMERQEQGARMEYCVSIRSRQRASQWEGDPGAARYIAWVLGLGVATHLRNRSSSNPESASSNAYGKVPATYSGPRARRIARVRAPHDARGVHSQAHQVGRRANHKCATQGARAGADVDRGWWMEWARECLASFAIAMDAARGACAACSVHTRYRGGCQVQTSKRFVSPSKEREKDGMMPMGVHTPRHGQGTGSVVSKS